MKMKATIKIDGDILFNVLHLRICIAEDARPKTYEMFKDGQTVANYLKTGKPVFLKEFMRGGHITVE